MLDFASRGNEKSVSLCSNDLQLSETTGYSDTNMYASYTLYKEPRVVYSFGKAAGAAKGGLSAEFLYSFCFVGSHDDSCFKNV